MISSPSQSSDASQGVSWTLPVARRPWPLELLDSETSAWSDLGADTLPSSAPAVNSQGQACAPAQNLTSLIAQLSRQLRSIEQTFIGALRDLAMRAQSVAGD
ncbi:MAG: hypothetical protein JO219_09650, partial [Candidatus Eremiobacteraeota bacterium]|nr:hypothetical protein [Candidatus Eremiobacteraeota bacterium]